MKKEEWFNSEKQTSVLVSDQRQKESNGAFIPSGENLGAFSLNVVYILSLQTASESDRLRLPPKVYSY